MKKNFEWSDAWAGLAAMLVALPSAIAFGVAMYAPLGPGYAAAGAMAGVLGTAAIGLTVPAVGGAPRLISGPSAPAAAVMAALCARLAGGGMEPSAVIASLLLVGLFCGLLQALYGALGGGKLIKYIPYPVVAGYMTGVGLIVMLSQIGPFFGLPKGAHALHGLLTPGLWQWPAVAAALATAAATLAAPRVTKRIPEAIVGIGAGTLVFAAFSLTRPELMRLGGNPLVIGALSVSPGAIFANASSAFGALRALDFSDLRALLAPALTLSVLLAIDTLKSCVVTNFLVGARYDSDRELAGQGAGNALSALVGGMPGSGEIGASMISIMSGGKTRWAGVLEGLFSLAAAFALGSAIGHIPLAALAGILTVVGARMIDRPSLKLALARSTVLDFAVVAAVAGTALASDLITAAGVGIGLSILLFLREQTRSGVIRRRTAGDHLFSTQRRLPAEREVLAARGAETLVLELQGSLFFGTTDQLFSEIEDDLCRRRRIILDMRRVTSVDLTAVHMLEQVERMLRERGGKLAFSHLPPNLPSGQDLRAYFKTLGLAGEGKAGRVFDTLHDALEWAEAEALKEGGLERAADAAPLDLSQIDFLRGLEPSSLAGLRKAFAERRVKAGEAVFRRKDAGAELFLIRRGQVRIVLPLKGTHRLHHLAVLGPGDFFGETSFLAGSPRSADALALSDAELYAIDGAAFEEVTRRDPAVGAAFYRRLAAVEAARLSDTDQELRRLQDS
ncbi:MAG: SulP family inorganic anion transporter [Elusimicrobia bacterium]|nr:SulP family inorganic anion transporter [Elusimicrobiota bacterium]